MPRRQPKLTRIHTAGHPQLRLAHFFQRNGYIRAPREERREQLGWRYKKGWEVRLVLNSQDELNEVRRLLKEAGIRAGKPFKKSNQWVQPIYGAGAVVSFMSWAAKVRASS